MLLASRGRLAFGVLMATCAFHCSAPVPSSEVVDTTASPIQGGTNDTTHLFAVGVLQTADASKGMVSFCSGVLLAPNLVATARHCVAELSSSEIDCATSTFGALYPLDKVFVTDNSTITSKSTYVDVNQVIVPTGADQNMVCGNDLALLVLSNNITLPSYVEPVIDPPMTSSQYQMVVTAIGYGVSTPEDTTGTTAGVRRIKENVNLFCIPNDPDFTDCFNIPMGRQAVAASEFISGDSTCEGDSGSGAFEQSNFDAGRWVAFGVLSRGGTSTDGSTCVQPTYTRFDAWGPLLAQAAMAAQEAATAQKASYTLPAWVATATSDAGCTGSSCVQSGQAASGSSAGDGGRSMSSNGATTTSSTSGGSSGGGCSAAGSGSNPGSPGGGAWPLAALAASGALVGARRRRRSGRARRAATP